MDDIIKKKIKYVKSYMKERNAADSSIVDSNANVNSKNLATLQSELYKKETIYLNRALMHEKLYIIFNREVANGYINDLENHIIYKHDETSLYPYCVSISMYPFMKNGLRDLGGESNAPLHLDSYCGGFINLLFAIAAGFAGAVATPEFLLNFDYFARKDLGHDYMKYEDHKRKVKNCFEQVSYSCNQPAASRGYQSVFWNISIFDSVFFKSLFENYVYPDMSKPDWESFNALQRYFLEWLQEERKRATMTFPVISNNLVTVLDENLGYKVNADLDHELFTAHRMVAGDDFFNYHGDPSALSSCCRLRNEIDANEFSFSLGAGGVMTGSLSVMTINVPRVIQNAIRDGEDIISAIRKVTKRVHKYQIGFRAIIKDYYDAGLLPAYNAGYITMDKQFLTVGLVGIPEAYQSIMHVKPQNNDHYKDWCNSIINTITEENKKIKSQTGFKFNTEMVPGESAAVKLAKWDAEDGYEKFDNYTSYFFLPDDNDINISDKFILHAELGSKLDGGQALHLNLDDQYATVEQALFHLRLAARLGLNYWCWNVKRTICKDCGKITKKTLDSCPICGSTNITHATRIIGYLKAIESFTTERQKEEAKRVYHHSESSLHSESNIIDVNSIVN